MELSSVDRPAGSSARLKGRLAGGAPIYTYRRRPGLPPVSVARFRHGTIPSGGLPPDHAHTHDFLVLAYFEAGGGSLRIDERDWPVRAGDAFVIAPGEVIGPGVTGSLEAAEAWAVFFPPDVVEPRTAGAFLSWRAHPLLFPFVGGLAGGAQRLHVPSADRPGWSERFRALDRELRDRRDGYNEAVLAHLTLLLVGLSRLAADVAGDLALRDEPLLATVFDIIETRYDQPISLKDVAAAAGLSPGHLTTVVGRKTGRTVQLWIAERRMTEARRLLAGTDLTVEAVATRVGYRDVSYFIRSFKSHHGVTPLEWRRAGRVPVRA
jgi:AraC-like DNA-binding protein/quercetin dioxygenase-like cupin family protein